MSDNVKVFKAGSIGELETQINLYAAGRRIRLLSHDTVEVNGVVVYSASVVLDEEVSNKLTEGLDE